MNHTKLLILIKKIILKHCNPSRIWVFGSRVEGNEKMGSDLDIAFDDSDCKENIEIQKEVNELNTLIQIDVKNIAFADKRFAQRIRDTGQVIYSKNKRDRVEDSLNNYSNALDKFKIIVGEMEDFKKDGYGDVYLDVLLKRFEFTFEMAWKTIKRYLDYEGMETMGPRSTIKAAFAQGLINDETTWLEMLERRNFSSHVYNEWQVKDILKSTEDLKSAFERLKKTLDELIG